MNNDRITNTSQRIRKIVGLVFLGIAIGLAVNQITVSLKHEVTISIDLSDDLVRDLTELDLRVSEVESTAEVVSLTRFFFDERHRPETRLTKVLNLTNGRYEVGFTVCQTSKKTAIILTRALTVDGGTAVGYQLP